MTAYQGGKKLLAKRIHAKIKELEATAFPDQQPLRPYFEPFVGMASVLLEFAKDNDGRELYACDAHSGLIKMWRRAQRGWVPPTTCTRERYDDLKSSRPSAERAFIGFCMSFGGVFFQGGYRGVHREYAKKGSADLVEAAKAVRHASFLDPRSYTEFQPEGMVIYADPPYKGNRLGDTIPASKRLRGRGLFQGFDHEEFWNTMREWSKSNLVVVSEREAPYDFRAVLEVPYRVSTGPAGSGRTTKRYAERLYVYGGNQGNQGCRHRRSRSRAVGGDPIPPPKPLPTPLARRSPVRTRTDLSSGRKDL